MTRLSLHDADAEQAGEEQLVALKQRAAHVPVDAAGEVVVQGQDAPLKVRGFRTAGDRLRRGRQMSEKRQAWVS